MPSTTSYNFGDVVLVAFPLCTNPQATKKRHAVIISRQSYHKKGL